MNYQTRPRDYRLHILEIIEKNQAKKFWGGDFYPVTGAVSFCFSSSITWASLAAEGSYFSKLSFKWSNNLLMTWNQGKRILHEKKTCVFVVYFQISLRHHSENKNRFRKKALGLWPVEVRIKSLRSQEGFLQNICSVKRQLSPSLRQGRTLFFKL